VRVPSCASVMRFTIASPRPTPACRSYAFGAALKRRDKRGNHVCADRLAGVSTVSATLSGMTTGRDPHGALFRQVVDDCVVAEVRAQLQQQRV